MHRLRPAAAELPLLAGVLAGWWLLWWQGHAFVLDGAVEGYGWADYLENAWMVTHREDLGYANFRRPLHGALLGHLGEAMGSYADAGIVLSSLAAGGAVLAAGLLARALAGPWAAGAASVAVVSTQVAITSARWANNYTLLAGTSGLSLALAACCARWPRWWLALLAGLSGGLAWGVDSRGLAMLPGAAALVLLGAARARRVGVLLAFALPMAIGPVSQDALWLDGVQRPGPVEQLRFQRSVSLRWARNSHDPVLIDACADEAADTLPTLGTLQTPCAQAMWSYNLSKRFPAHLPWPAGVVALAALALLVPGRRRGEAVDGIAALGGGLASLVAFAWWFPYPDRYLLPFCVPLAVIVPVGLARVLGRVRPWALAVGAVVALAGAWVADPTERNTPTKLQFNPQERLKDRVAAQVASVLGDGDAFLDCADFHTATRWLPRLVAPAPPMAKVDEARCVAWLKAPSGGDQHYVLVQPGHTFRLRDGDIVPLERYAGRWVLARDFSAVQLWRHKAP